MGVWGVGNGPFDSPPARGAPTSVPLTCMVNLLPFVSYLAGYKSVSVRPSDPDTMTIYRYRSYCFIERLQSENRIKATARENVIKLQHFCRSTKRQLPERYLSSYPGRAGGNAFEASSK